MKKLRIIITISASILFTGCANPSFNPNVKKVVFVEGKPFRVPVGATHTPHTFTTSEKSKEKRKVYNKYGMNCRLGDILWIENYTIKQSTSAYKKDGKIAGYTYVAQASREGKAGCTKAISNQEYSFYRSKEMEASANARARANLAAAMTPKTVNVQHTGHVNQNVNVSGTMNHNVNHSYNPYRTY